MFIVGPTGSGKTGLSQAIAQHVGCQIINADMGQFYTPLSVGTAKPDWKNDPFPSHLFDILDQPVDLSVVKYRSMVLEIMQRCQQSNDIPVLVGGAFFYVKSLFFPLKEFIAHDVANRDKGTFNKDASTQELWDFLNNIDPDRAAQIHPHDRYRIARALDIWEKTGQKPSGYLPKFDPGFDSLIVVLLPDKKILEERIRLRTVQMVKDEGWIEEAKRLIDTQWEEFILKKGLIGYEQLFAWIRNGEKQEELDDVIGSIQIATLQYAKRQRTFIRGLVRLLEKHKVNSEVSCDIVFVQQADQAVAQNIIDLYSA